MEWLRARVADHAAYARATQAPATPGSTAQLWRERPAGEAALPGFVPPTSLAPLVREVQAGVVNINTVGPRDVVGTATRATGSGFILNADGYVVTNNHVIAKARAIQVRLGDGREFPAEVVGRDPETDVALLKLRASGPQRLPTVFLGDSDRLEVGEWVVAIGNPFGLDHSVAHGMVSAKERILGVGIFDDFIQTDALINPGNSGGPLFNMRGEVVGVNTAIISQGQGIGFAVPINLVKELLPNLRENGRAVRGWLGVSLKNEPSAPGAEGLADTGVAEVETVFRDSPAARAGIRPGDRLVGVNGKATGDYQQLKRRVKLMAPGTEATFTLKRGREVREVRVTIGVPPAQEPLEALQGPGNLDRVGLVVADLPAEAAAAAGYKPFAGVLVVGVTPGGSAQAAGLREGDLVVEVNRKRVRDVAGVRSVLEGASPAADLLLRVQRGDALQYVVLKPS
ncbi:PDZ domain-containing protein [Aggregicoccus sp. 17bor-14]|uniref:trypsin-like peptidase domain-containing protein n=1 Tax=Myxococcaceae TaxID=31 RepID=UPI00129C2B64|nr:MULTISPECIES: trypsin-like peptidase domain-containing protein [Myxococcaceae]MBF5044165.1 trypsin-like peptidase domain-containing protein [Simulacricoccus sp. 17bor-14]MRI89915.1 PDZ domain-containing protein [Aggregicoccus sp. 17bor-14]